MPWWIGAIVANFGIAANEYLSRTSPFGYFETLLKRTGPVLLLAQWGIFRTFNGEQNWMLAWAVLTVGNSVFRVASVHWLAADQVSSWPLALAGIGVMIGGAFILKTGLP
jgi:hypothetical protein